MPGLTGRAMAMGLMLGGLLSQASGEGIFTCVDSKGRRLTADRPIAECVDREQQEISPGGIVKRRIGPSLTSAERAEEEEKARKQLEDRNRLIEEKRRDRALLNRYPDRASHDLERFAALAQVESVIAAANHRTTELAVQRKRLEGEMEFFKLDPSKAAPQLKRQIEENQQHQEAQKRFIANQEAEKQRIGARYDEELARLKQLWAAHPQAPAKAKALN